MVQEHHGSGHRLAAALAALGMVCVRLGDLSRAEDALRRTLEVRTPVQLHERSGDRFGDRLGKSPCSALY